MAARALAASWAVARDWFCGQRGAAKGWVQVTAANRSAELLSMGSSVSACKLFMAYPTVLATPYVPCSSNSMYKIKILAVCCVHPSHLLRNNSISPGFASAVLPNQLAPESWPILLHAGHPDASCLSRQSIFVSTRLSSQLAQDSWPTCASNPTTCFPVSQ